jgi:hypothetical protein
MAAGEREMPGSSSVGTMAMRELDGADMPGEDMHRLSTLVNEVDGLVNAYLRPSEGKGFAP